MVNSVLAFLDEFMGMAELVELDRSGSWQRKMREREEVAIGFRGARPDPNAGNDPLAELLRGNMNRSEPKLTSVYDIDEDIIKKLEASGKVDVNELLTYYTPDALLQQGEEIDPSNTNIISYVNKMARGRRMLFHYELKNQSNTDKARKIVKQVFSDWPAAIQMLQGQVAEVKIGRYVRGRYVRIPPLLVTDIKLQ